MPTSMIELPGNFLRGYQTQRWCKQYNYCICGYDM